MADKGIVSEILKQKLSEKPEKERSKSQKGEIKRTSIALPADLYRQIKAYAAIEGRKMNDLMVELLREALKKRLKGKDFLKGWEI